MRRTLKERGLERGQEKDRRILELLNADAPYAEFKRTLLELEKHWLKGEATETGRLRIRRSIAEDLVSQAYAFDMPWKEFGTRLRVVQRLGFSNLALRVHIACLYVQSLHLYPRQARDAWDMLEDAERRLLRVPKAHFLRKEGLSAIAHAKSVTTVSRPSSRRRA
ncbi:hypothetical protein [Archangium primigenium]|uniref:hypothetical protein n=1 Tax=[Archangium] primigenium TaxID=2792470 RepID=UPI00195EFE3D|nr:hypothetical protein [Archangium primigenium]MBM7113757.1 hypothetical protein [Archangium primigenium]